MKPTTVLLFCITTICLLCACGPSTKVQIFSADKLPPLDSRQEVHVYTSGEALPGNIIRDIGTVKVGDTGFSLDCGYEKVIATAKEEARKSGGNVVFIEEHQMPDFWSTCHRINAKILLVNIDSSRIKNIGYQPVDAYEKVFNTPSSTKKNIPWLIGLSAGGGYHTAKAADGADPEYINKKRFGLVVGADVNYYFNDYLGCGFKFSMFNKSLNIMLDNWTQIKETINIFFVGPVFSARSLDSKKKHAFYTNIAIGYTGFRDKVSESRTFEIVTANTLGLVCDIGYDIGISETFAIGLQLSSFLGSFKNYTVTTPAGSTSHTYLDKQAESIARIDFTVGLKFRR